MGSVLTIERPMAIVQTKAHYSICLNIGLAKTSILYLYKIKDTFLEYSSIALLIWIF